MTQRGPEIIDGRQILSKWYGVDSTVCHIVRRTGKTTAECQFEVGQNLCGPKTRPPMFDHISFEDRTFKVQTNDNSDQRKGDAWQHFIDSAGKRVVPGHNLIGAAAEAIAQNTRNRNFRYSPGADFLYIDGFDFFRFKSLVLPGEEVGISGSIDVRSDTICATLALRGKPFTRNLQVGTGKLASRADLENRLDQHWLVEHAAQGLGVVGLHENIGRSVFPILVEIGISSFARVPILAGDLLTSHLTIRTVDEKQIYGDAVIYTASTQVADIQKVLLQLKSMKI